MAGNRSRGADYGMVVQARMTTNSEPHARLEEQSPLPAGATCYYCHRTLDTAWTGAVLIDVSVVDPSTFGVSFRHNGAYQVQYVSSLPHILKLYPM